MARLKNNYRNKQNRSRSRTAGVSLSSSAPAGYNLVVEDPQVIPEADGSTIVEVPNGSGSVLPSTGGIGTTIFYIIGGLLIVAAVVFFVVRRRADAE